ncbi:RILP-like protein 1 [Lampris incognitus]|uniref:RILP-like protein 1 n=1 Tax=Lampris incognitus TaxID=2546036 RepID=UPI0024B59379|nr:RILP-like protein 1 [Lampris incognitus]
MERTETDTEPVKSENCFDRTYSALTVDDVYAIAKTVGAEVEKLIDGYGKESAVGLVPKIVKVLELLESFASRNHVLKQREEELLKAFETLQVQQQRKRAGKDGEEGNGSTETRELQHKEEQWRRRCEELQAQVQQLQQDRQELHSRLKGSHCQEDRVQRQEREVMLKLKEVVDKQRDELRAKVQEIATFSKEVEALQEQLERFMKMNGELRHKQSVLEAQLKSTVERKADMEADLREKHKQIERLQAQMDKAVGSPSNPCQTFSERTENLAVKKKDQDQPCFTKKEVRDMLFERNELKANLFLVQEELKYYQREILNDERCPGFLLNAVRSTIKKRRTLIKAKMLGIPVDECSSDEEDKGPLFEQTETDSSEEKPAESRIRNLFGFLTRSGNSRNPNYMSHSASSWEIIGDSEASRETEPQPPF